MNIEQLTRVLDIISNTSENATTLAYWWLFTQTLPNIVGMGIVLWACYGVRCIYIAHNPEKK